MPVVRRFENPKMTKKKTLLKLVMKEAHRIWKMKVWLFFGECVRDAWMIIRTGLRTKKINVAQVSMF